MKDYFQDIVRYKLLTAQQEVSLSHDIQQAMRLRERIEEEGREVICAELGAATVKKTVDRGDYARQKMAAANLRLVVLIAKRYINRNVSLPDLVQEGSIGLIRACEKYDGTRGCRFSTYACVPTTTEILTKRGWLKYDQVQARDMTIGYNLATGETEWTVVEAVANYEDAPLLRFGDGRWSTLCTPNHKWLMQDSSGTSLRPIEEWPQGSEMSRRTKNMSLVLSAPFVGGSSPLSEDEAALLAWVHSDGYISWRQGEPTKLDGAHIFQTEGKFAGDIRALLTRLDALSSDLPHGTGSCRKFWVKGCVLRPIWEKAELHNRSLFDLVLDLTPAARKAFNDAWYKADGSQGRNSITDGHGAKLDALELSLFLEGRSCLRRSYKGEKCSILSWRDKPVNSRRCLVTPAGRGHVWCPSTALASWTARDENGNVFLTGNTWWIRQSIVRAIADQSRTVRLPVYLYEIMGKMSRLHNEYQATKGRNATDAELCAALGLSQDRLEFFQKSTQTSMSLDKPLPQHDQGDLTYQDTLVGTSCADQTLEFQCLQDDLKKVFTHLEPIQQQILYLRYGFEDGSEKTLEEVARRLQISREKVRQHEASAIRKLRRKNLSKVLIEYIIPGSRP